MAYENLRQIVIDIVNCEDSAPTPVVFVNKIGELRDNGTISVAQHSDLMRYVADLV